VPHNIRVISVKDFVRTDVTGNIDLAASKQILKEIASVCTPDANHHVLIDYRKAHTRLTLTEVFQMASSLSEIGLGIHNRLAILAPPVVDFDRAGFFETVARNRGFQVRAFRDFEQAFDWLTQS
jgi:hypothetical protein